MGAPVTEYLIESESQALHLIALRAQGLTYPEIIEQEGIPLTPKKLQWRVDFWRKKLGISTGSGRAPFLRRLPHQAEEEPVHANASACWHWGMGSATGATINCPLS